MSHIVTIQTQLKDPAAIRAACQRLHLPAPIQGEHTLFATKQSGLGVKLPEWYYPVVITTDGTLHYDNYGGAWGKDSHLNAFQQAYAVEKARIEARKHGHTFAESTQADGSVRVTITQH